MTVTPAARFVELHHPHHARMLFNAWTPTPRMGGWSADQGTGTDVYLWPIYVYHTVTVDAMGFVRGSGAPGVVQVKQCLYADNGETPTGGAVLRSTAAAGVGAASQKLEVALSASIQLAPGLYWGAFVFDAALGNAVRRLSASLGAGSPTLNVYLYTPTVAFTFDDPCPAVGTPSLAPDTFLMVPSSP